VEKRLTAERYLYRSHDPQQSALSTVGLLQMIAAAAAAATILIIMLCMLTRDN